ncbi:MAG: hypothetical protein WHT07_02540 [Desulfobaccales bacterium]
MVDSNTAQKAICAHPVVSPVFPEEEFHWTTVRLREVLDRGLRLEGKVFGIEGRHARETLKRCKWPIVSVGGENGLAKSITVPGRVKRKYLSSDAPEAIGFLGSSEMLDVKPVPYKWVFKNEPKYQQFKIREGLVLISCSGTIGNVTYVSKTLNNFMISQHAIRISADFPGYIYAFLKTSIGQALVKTNMYGAVVSEIEPHHFDNVLIPDPPPILKKRIHDLILESYKLRDESNELLDQAEQLLYYALNLPPIDNIRPQYFDPSFEVRNFIVKFVAN